MPHAFFASHARLFAHRGGAGLAPENTTAAFDSAAAIGVDGFELDVRLSRDNIVVVHHDARLDRTTNLQGPIHAFTADELARADAGYRFDSDGSGAMLFRGQDIGIPRLDAVLERHRNHRVIIELKDNTAELARAVAAAVRRADAVDRVCLGSFGLRVLRAVREVAPEIATSAAREEVRWALYRSWLGLGVGRARYGGYQVPERAGATRVVSPRFVAAAHGAGLRVQVWTVDTAADALRLLGWGVDALITDRPDVLAPVMSGGTQPSSD